jgi:putative AlgH/UPF0301 family transcriptional regulator
MSAPFRRRLSCRVQWRPPTIPPRRAECRVPRRRHGLVIEHVLHGPDYRCPGTMAVSEIAALTAYPGILEDIAAGRGPKHSLFVLGYAGCGPDQLENELAAGAWLVVEPDATLLFDEETTTKWQRAYDRRGIEL